MRDRRCPDCDVTMQAVELVTTGGHTVQLKTGEAREGWLGKLGVNERKDVETLACPECGLLRQYVDPEFWKQVVCSALGPCGTDTDGPGNENPIPRRTNRVDMSTPPGEYYTEERWQNWLDRIAEEEIDPEDEDSARLLLNLQDDTAIAVAKIITDFDEGELGEETALEELADIRETVLSEVDIDDEEKLMLVDGVQTSLVCVFYAAEEFVAGGPPAEGTVGEYIEAASEAESEEDLDAALGYCAQAGTLIIDGAELDREITEDLEFGLVAEWVNGLDSLQTAMSDPEVVEEDDE